MAKKKIEGTEKILTFFREEGAYGFQEVEIPSAILQEHGVVISKPSADVFAIFLNNITKKTREIFGI